MIEIHPATRADAQGMCDVINPLIVAGGSTAHRTLFDPDRMDHHYIMTDRKLSCMVARSGKTVLGFQSLAWAGDTFPDHWAIIASFVATGHAGKGIGRRLFDATQTAARTAGVQTIDATIRADNTSGLTYYAAIGFTDYDRQTGVKLSDGTPVDRICKRFDL